MSETHMYFSYERDGDNATFYLDHDCTIVSDGTYTIDPTSKNLNFGAHNEQNATSQRAHSGIALSSAIPGSCISMGAFVSGEFGPMPAKAQMMYTLVNNGPISDVSKALQAFGIVGNSFERYAWSAPLSDTGDCTMNQSSSHVPTLTAYPLYDDGWFGSGSTPTATAAVSQLDIMLSMLLSNLYIPRRMIFCTSYILLL